MIKKAKAQITFEFIAFWAVICFALIAARYYMERALQGRYRQLADDIGNQYDPQATTGTSTVTTHTTTSEYMVYDGDEYEGTAILSTTEQDMNQRETVGAVASGGSSGGTVAGW